MKHIKEVIQEWLMTSPVVLDDVKNRVQAESIEKALETHVPRSHALSALIRQHLDTVSPRFRLSVTLMVIMTLQRADGVEMEEYEGGPRQFFNSFECHLATHRLMREYIAEIVPRKEE